MHIAQRALAYGIAAIGLTTTLTAMAALHPYEYVYFNALTDTKTPGALAEWYDMDYWHMTQRQLLEYLLARYPDDTLRVWTAFKETLILPSSDRERIVYTGPAPDANFHLFSREGDPRDMPDAPRLHSIWAYGSDIAFIIAPNSAAYRDFYRAAYEYVEANGTLLARADFDIYVHNGALHYLSANCAPLADGKYIVFLHIVPSDLADLPADRREYGFENLDFRIADHNVFSTHIGYFDGKCVTRRRLPDYSIARISTGRMQAPSDSDEWRADIDLAAHAAAQALYESVAAGDYGQPVAQSDFDVYLSGNVLAYLKEPCEAGDADARFFLHIFPANPADLPLDVREFGFANLDFQFADHGADIGGKCVASRELPAYAIERIRTGQFVSGEGRVWGAEFSVAR